MPKILTLNEYTRNLIGLVSGMNQKSLFWVLTSGSKSTTTVQLLRIVPAITNILFLILSSLVKSQIKQN